MATRGLTPRDLTARGGKVASVASPYGRLFRSAHAALETGRHLPESLQRRFQALHDLRGDFFRRRQEVRVVEGIVLQPEDIEVDLFALDQVGIGEFAEAFGF